MSALEKLSCDIKQILNDVRIDKVTVRTKSLESLQRIFDERSDELIKLLSYENEISWTDLYHALHEALKEQAIKLDTCKSANSLVTAQNKNGGYISAIQKCINLANSHHLNVSYRMIFQTVFDCFSNKTICKYFDVCYLQIVRKHILDSRCNLAEVKINEWSRLLSYLFELYEKSDMQKLNLLECFPLIIQHGTKYTHLINDLNQYLPNMIRIVEQDHQFKAQKQVLLTVYELTINLALNERISVCWFNEMVLEKLIKYYEFRMYEDAKIILFKIFHISIAIHYPQTHTEESDQFLAIEDGSTGNILKINYAYNVQLWHKHLRNMLFIVEREIKELNKQSTRSQPNTSICSIFIRMAAKLCSVIFWDENVWTNAVENQPEQKRRRCSDKLQRVMEMVEYENGKFCWRWMAILSQLLFDYPTLLQIDDYQPLLKLLTDFQPTIQFSVQANIFNALVSTLLSKETDLKTKSSMISATFCSDHWFKIMQLAFKNSATNNTTTQVNLKLLQILINNKITISHEFLATIIREILSNSIKKSNLSLELLISIFRNVNTDLFENAHEIKTALINWLSPKVKASELKRVIANDEKLDLRLISELNVLCVLSKMEMITKSMTKSIKESDCDDFTATIQHLEHHFSYLVLNKLIVIDGLTENTDHLTATNLFALPATDSIKAVFNETFYADLEKILNPDDNCPSTANVTDDFMIVSSSLGTYVNVLNQFLAYQSMDTDKYKKSFLTKRILLKIEHLNLIVERFGKLDQSDVSDILEKLELIWNENLHPILRQHVFEPNYNKTLIKWLTSQLSSRPRANSTTLCVLKSINEMPFNEKIQLRCLTLLAYFSAYGDENALIAFRKIEEFIWNFKCNEDLFIILELVKIIIFGQVSTENRAEWAFDALKSICQKLTLHQEFIELVVECIPALVKCIKPYPSMHDDLMLLITTFLTQSKKRKYGQTLCTKIIYSVKYVAKEFGNNEHFFDLFAYLEKFLHMDLLSITFATVECLTQLFNKNWLNCNDQTFSCMEISDFQLNLFQKMHLNDLKIATDDNADKKCRTLATRIQMHCALIANCFSLRRENWFNLIEFCCHDIELNNEKLLSIVKMLCLKVFHLNHIDVLEDTIPYLISMWIMNNYHLAIFPRNFTRSTIENDFLLDYKKELTLATLRYQPNMLPEFQEVMLADSLLNILNESIIVDCLAYIMPLNFESSQTMSPKYIQCAKSLLKLLNKEMPKFDEYLKTHPLKVVEQLLINTWDDKQFYILFGTNVEYVKDEHTINFQIFCQSLDFIQKISGKETNIIEKYCMDYPNIILNLLNSFKFHLQHSTFEEQKLCFLYRICILIDLIGKFLINNCENSICSNVVEFFVRDLLYFFGNVINTNEYTTKLKLAACKYFLQFCKTILPVCAQQFKPILNFVVSILVPMIKQNENDGMTCVSLNLLDFLIIEQKDCLQAAISNLDNFPTQTIFDELRDTHHSIKYNGRVFTLTEEIEYFLLVNKRKVEGLIALKNHLSTKKEELQHIYKRIYDSHGFSEDCDKSIIHRLIFVLLQTIQGVDAEKSVMAARCLGELGPSDLGTIVLKSDVQLHSYRVCTNLENATVNLCEVAFEQLNNLLTHTDARVLKTVSQALEHLLQTKIGNNFIRVFPHLSVFKTQIKIDSPLKCTDKPIELLSLFINPEILSFSVWIKRFTILLFDLFDDSFLSEVVALQANFAEAMLPLLVKAMLASQTKTYRDQLSEVISIFFRNHYNENNLDCLTENHDNIPIHFNKCAIKSMLNVAECVRVHNLNVSKLDEKMEMPYLHIAKAAYYCEAHFTAILYGELVQIEKPSADEKLLAIMKGAHQSIGELDAVPAFVDPVKSRSQYLELNQSWDQIFLQQDALAFNRPHNMNLYTKYLTQSGLYCLANRMSQQMNENNYECAWRLGDWKIFDTSTEHTNKNQKINISVECEKYHYFALKCFQEKDEAGVKANVKKAREQIIQLIKQSSFECTKNIYKNLASLHMLEQIEEFSDIQFQTNELSAEFIINKWKHNDAIPSSDFNYREPILAQRLRIVSSAGIRAKRKIESIYKIDEGIQEMLLNLSSECRKEGYYNFATRYLTTLNSLILSREMKAKLYIEDSKLNWSLGNHSLAKQLVKGLSNEKFISLSILTAKRVYGEYLAESRSENTKNIINDYLMKSLEMLNQLKLHKHKAKDNAAYAQSLENIDVYETENKLSTYQSIAKYADREYQQTAAYKKSTIYEKKRTNITKNQTCLSQMEKQKKLTPDENKSKYLLQCSIKIDENDIKSLENDYAYYLQLAVENYAKCVLLETNGHSNNSFIFRIFAIWFSNKSNPAVLEILKKNFLNIPSYKYIALMPQITTHLSNAKDEFSGLIGSIVEKCAIDHPHHIIYQILALANAFKDENGTKNKNEIPPRVEAAQTLLRKLNQNRKVHLILDQMEKMCPILINLANTELTSSGKISSKEPLLKLKDLNLIQCPTIHLPISIDAKYPTSSIISIVKWKNTYFVPGGINAPKKIECLCSDGIYHSQLLKGKDDLRQDAVMQQVFNIMNSMLSQSKTTRKNRLKVRTYIVAPLSQRSGILEWCVNTIPLTEYLVGSSSQPGAHERYFPHDFKPMKCRKIISNEPARTTPFEKLYANFLHICENFHPALHYFFYEKFYSPGVWFERRLAYAHSLATTSMIGYILGIGDRHVSNILIDETTAELIHIDFGIAFEQGKCLPTPERIPFRLTADLVSALGSTGVEGVFRKSCEKTMDVLRQNKSTILTILEVLLHDPSHSWTLTNKKACIQQNSQNALMSSEDDQDINSMAERALLRLEEKLDGKHISRSEVTTVEGHVEILIQEAICKRNLCQLFHGFQAYL